MHALSQGTEKTEKIKRRSGRAVTPYQRKACPGINSLPSALTHCDPAAERARPYRRHGHLVMLCMFGQVSRMIVGWAYAQAMRTRAIFRYC
jgi:hypothetical protein